MVTPGRLTAAVLVLRYSGLGVDFVLFRHQALPDAWFVREIGVFKPGSPP